MTSFHTLFFSLLNDVRHEQNAVVLVEAVHALAPVDALQPVEASSPQAQTPVSLKNAEVAELLLSGAERANAAAAIAPKVLSPTQFAEKITGVLNDACSGNLWTSE